ncbi:Alpha/Beta hydrolase protein [Hysterangium stoloniferum]|nr:Alpha/Beta hydrolase protein [Hysterangium stoloniferum]
MASASPSSQANFADKVNALLSIGSALLAGLFSVLTYPFSSSAIVQPTLHREATRVVVRQFLDTTNPAQLQWMIPNSTKAYTDWVKNEASKQDAPSQVVSERIGDDGAKLHWVGNRDAKKVILHFHGGGLVMSLSNGHISMINSFRREVKGRKGIDVKCAFLGYTLAPGTRYPGQFRQAVLAVKHVLGSGISPGDLVLTGDSAGGMLCIQIVSHILHPHPELPVLPVPAVPFAGIVLMSPWLIFDSESDSFLNNKCDLISMKPLLAWGRLIREGTAVEGNKNEPGGFWSEPGKAPVEWWNGTDKVSRHFLLTFGDREVFKDDIVKFGATLQTAVEGTNVAVKVVGGPAGLHADPTMDAVYGREVTELTKIIAGWIHDGLVSA